MIVARFDRFDGHKILFICVVMGAGLFSVVPFIANVCRTFSDLWLLIFAQIYGQGVIWFVVGAFTGGMDTGANTLIVWVWKEKVNPFMQLLHCK